METSIRQTETDRNRHAFGLGHRARDHAKNTSLIKERVRERQRERERERLRAKLRERDRD